MANRDDKTKTTPSPTTPTTTKELVGFEYQIAQAITVALKDATDAAKPVRDRIAACKDTGCSTNKNFYDIIYIPQKRRFWLMNKSTTDALGKAANDFKTAVTINSPEKRLEELSKYGISELFITPDMFGFLTEAEKKEYKENEAYANEQMLQIKNRENNETILSRIDAPQQAVNSQASGASAKCIELKSLAEARAKEKGYVIAGSSVYSQAQIDVKKYLTQYIESVEAIKAVKDDKYDNIFKAITYYQELAQNYNKHSYAIQTTTYGGEIVGFSMYLEYLNYQHNKMNGLLANHIELITKLANLGIAVPEYAFCPQNATQGIKDFLIYANKLDDKKTKEQDLESQFKAWKEALGNKATLVPTKTFENEIKKILTLNDQIIEQRNVAEKRIADSPVPMFCVWSPEQFKPEPVEFLFKAVNPMQEYSTPKQGNKSLGLAHLSLAALSDRIDEDLSKLLAKGEVASLNDNDNEIELFETYLKDQQAKPLEIDEQNWFYKDKNSNMSVFSYIAFFDYLKQQNLKVDTLNDQATQTQWGEKLQKIIFASNVIHNIMLFDTSPGAALIRSLTFDPQMLATKFEATGPTLKLGASDEDEKDITKGIYRTKTTNNHGVQPKSQLATVKVTSVETKIMVAPFKGEVTLLDITFPPEGSSLRDFEVTYTDKDQQQKTVSFGQFFINFVAKAWGFAGASLMLGGDMSLGVNKSQFSLSSAYKGTSKQINAKVDIFMGAQAGIKLLGELRWNPPKDLQNYAEVLQIERQRKFSYRIVSRLEVSAALAAGAGWTADFGFGLVNSKFYFYMKAKIVWGVGASGNIAFEVDYDSLGDIISLLCFILKDAQYQRLEFIDNDAFKYLTTASSLFVIFGSPVFWVSRTLPELVEVYKTSMGVDNIQKVAERIALAENAAELKTWAKLLPPEALGPLLFSLSEPQNEWSFPSVRSRSKSITGMQQQAISNLLAWITEGVTDFSATVPNTEQLLFEKALARMNTMGYRADKPKTEYCAKLDRLQDFIKLSSNLREKTYADLKNDFDMAINKLNKHMEGKCVVSWTGSRAAPYKQYAYKGADKDE